MARNGSGTYSLPEAAFVFNTTIDESAVNNNFNDIATALTESIARDGQTTISANLPMNSKKLTGLAVGTGNADSLTLGQAQNAGYALVGSVAGTDTITGGMTPAITAYAAGQKFAFVAAATNTGATTINIDSNGAKSITKKGTTALAASDILSGMVCLVVYDGTRFQLVNPASDTSSSATESAEGLVELATQAEVNTGTDTARSLTPATLKSHLTTPNPIGGTTPSTGAFTTFTSTGIDDNGAATAITIDSSNDVQFSGTAQFSAGEGCVFNGDSIDAAHTLDDYEEGTWTPAVEGSGGSAGSIAYSTQTGTYTKIGRIVFLKARIILTNKGSWTGNASITGLPFTTPSIEGSGVVWGDGLNITSGHSLVALAGSSNTQIDLYEYGDTTGVFPLDMSGVQNTSQFSISIFYEV